MPSGLKRFHKAESLHFIAFSRFHRLPLPEAPGVRETAEAALVQTRASHRAPVYAHVPMPEHVHSLVNEPAQIVLAQFPESRSADDLAQAARTARGVLARNPRSTKSKGPGAPSKSAAPQARVLVVAHHFEE
jgi:hypothetical protein